ncbi:MAG: glycine betaine/L-proline ABC transporter ATP-binding protein [Spartobacteria bacterium]|nr:glycine betaine/L-proline ABC transporter ATP-binding protein [Spartobacteria bacterium]
MTAIIKLENVYKIFGRDTHRAFSLLKEGVSKENVLNETGCTVGMNDVSFEINQREIFVVMGLSGSGKSTVIRSLNRLIDVTSGNVMIDGEDIMKMSRSQLQHTRRTKLSMVFQHFGLLPQRSVIKNVEFGLEISGMKKAERRTKAEHALELVGLTPYADSMPSELSGGMQQRVGLARALANDPEVLLMDEAFSALDPLIRTQMQDELLGLQARMHKTIVFITHDLDEALKIGDRIAIMKDGAVVQVGTPEEILTDPADEYVKAFVQHVDRTKVLTAASFLKKASIIQIPKDGPRVAARRMEASGISSIFVVDQDRCLKGLLTIDDALRLEKDKNLRLTDVLKTDMLVAQECTPVKNLLAQAMTAKYPVAVITEEGVFRGIVDRATIMREVVEDAQDDNALVPLDDMDVDTNIDAKL